MGPDSVLSTLAGGEKSGPRAVGVGGIYAVVWRDTADEGPGVGDIRGRLVDNDGLPLGVELLINSTTDGDQRAPDIAVISIDDMQAEAFLVVWEDASGAAPDGEGTAIRGRLFGTDGSPLEVAGSTDDFVISERTAGDQRRPRATGMLCGLYMNDYWGMDIAYVVWEDWEGVGADAGRSSIAGRWLCLTPDPADCPIEHP